MSEKFRLSILKVIATLAIFSFLYPGFLIIQYFLCGRNSEWIYMPKLGSGLYNHILWLLAIVCFTFFALRSARKKLENNLAINIVQFGVVLFVLELIVTVYFNIAFNLIPFIYVGATSYLLVRNQLFIDEVFLRMNSQMADISKGVRGKNALWIVAFLAFVFLLMVFQNGITFMFNAIGNMIIFVLSLFASLFSHQTEKEVKQNEQKHASQPLIDKGESNPIVSNVLNILFFIVVAILIIKFAPKIIKGIYQLLKSIGNTIKATVSSILKKDIDEILDEEEYTDKIEKITLDAKIIKHSSKTKRRRRSESEFKKISNLSEKIRYLYALTLEKIIVNGVEIKEHYTADEVLENYLKSKKNHEGFQELTEAYKQVRYGEKVPESDVFQELVNKTKNI